MKHDVDNTIRTVALRQYSGCSRHIGDEETFWEDDATLIVLKADEKYFCAQRSVLRLESLFFRELLPFPPPQDQDIRFEVQLTDNAMQLQLFLKALHRYRLYYLSSESRSLSAKAAILRLSTKYKVQHLRNRTIRELSSYFPSTLEEYDAAQDLDISDEDFDLLSLVVEETKAKILLPVVRYMQCKRIAISSSYTKNIAPVLASVTPALIMRQVQINHIPISPDCYDLNLGCAFPYLTSCASFREKWFVKSLEEMERLLDPLYKKQPYMEMDHANFCYACAAESRRYFDSQRVKLWNDLPRIFGLGSWIQLRGEVTPKRVDLSDLSGLVEDLDACTT